MKHLLIIFSSALIMGILVTSAKAKQSDKIDEIEVLLQKVSANIQSSAEATKMAQAMNEQMVEAKVSEKEALKSEVAASKEQIGKYIETMLFFDVDTSYVDMEKDTVLINNMIRINKLK